MQAVHFFFQRCVPLSPLTACGTLLPFIRNTENKLACKESHATILSVFPGLPTIVA